MAVTALRRLGEASASLFERRRALRFVLVGGLNTAFSYALYAGLLLLGLNVAMASLLALVLGILFSFATQGKIVFRQASWFTFMKFLLAWTLFYFVNLGIIAVLMRVGLGAYLAGAVSTLPMTLLSYVALRSVVFRPPRSTPPIA